MKELKSLFNQSEMVRADSFRSILKPQGTTFVGPFLYSSLYQPIEDVLSRSGKNIRGQLLELGYLLADPKKQTSLNVESRALCVKLGEIIEVIHAGSLVIDDIEDQSLVRRGRPTLHREWGVPLALNAGNYLYFCSFEKLRELQLSTAQELRLYHLFHKTFLDAHKGQALDLGTPMRELDQEDVSRVVQAVLELKTGALMALALAVGGLVSGASPAVEGELLYYGSRFGMALQMFDDIGNLSCDKGDGKYREDLKLGRPSWIWWVAAQYLGSKDYAEFTDLCRLYEAFDEVPHCSRLFNQFVERTGLVQQAQQWAEEFLADVYSDLDAHFFDRSLVVRRIQTLGKTLVGAYV